MRTWKFFTYGIVLMAVVFLTASCASAPHSKVRKNGRNAADLGRARSSMASGEYKEAIAIYSAACDRNPGNEDLLDTYTEALETVRVTADRAYENQDFAKAGELYSTLSHSGFGQKPLQEELSFDADYLGKRIRACSKTLFELGIVKYRAGDLQNAIAIWKQVLVFDPADQEARTAIETAKIQLQNLKQIK